MVTNILAFCEFLLIMGAFLWMGCVMFRTLGLIEKIIELIGKNDRNHKYDESNKNTREKVVPPIKQKENRFQASSNLQPEQIPDDIKRVRILKAQMTNDNVTRETNPNQIVVGGNQSQVNVDLFTEN